MDQSPIDSKSPRDQHGLDRVHGPQPAPATHLPPVAAQVAPWELNPTTGSFSYSPAILSRTNLLMPATLKKLETLLHPDDRVNVMAHLSRLRREGGPLDLDYRLVAPGSNAVVSVHMQAVMTSDGRIVGFTQDTTSLVGQNQQLRQDLARYQTLVETMDEGFCIVQVLFDDADTAIDYLFVEVNPAFAQHTGLHHATGRRMRELAPDLEDSWFQHYGQVALTGESTRFVERAAALGGRWFDVHAFRVGDPELRTVAVLFTDITEARRADEALRAFEERLRRAIEIETVGVIFFRPEGPVTFANEAFLRMSGYTREDVERGLVRWDTLTPPEWMDTSQHAINRAFAQGRSTPYEKQYVRKNGTRWWALSFVSRIGENEGVKFIIDTTKAKRAEAERDRLAAIVENSRDAVIGIDLEGNITDWNPAAEELYGYRATEIVGRNVDVLIPEDRRREHANILELLNTRDNNTPTETVRLQKGGTPVEVEIRLSPVLDASHKVTGAALIDRDVTARKRLERIQEDFLAMASHDLRSPVTVLSGRAQLMKRRKAFDETGVDVILDQARRMERLIVDLQEMVKLEVGAFELQRRRIELADLAMQAADRVRLLSTGHTISVIAPEEPVMVEWDPDRISQVLDNLTGNAVKYSPDGGHITIRIERHENEARLSVSDHGPGIPAEQLPRLFERYYRAGTDRSVSGLGLGLYISRMLVEAHGGRIWAESEPDHGSTFTIALPFASNPH